MTKKKSSATKKVLGVSVLALAGIGLVSAATEDNVKEQLKGNEDIKAAIEAGDYDAFIDAVSAIDPDVANKVTEERFDQMVEKHELKTAVDEAIENADYNAWVAAVSQLPHGADIADIVTEDEFPKLIELHELREQAKELAKEIGLPEREHKRGGHGMQSDSEQRRGPPGQMQGEQQGQFGQDQNQRRGPPGQTINQGRQGGFFGWFR